MLYHNDSGETKFNDKLFRVPYSGQGVFDKKLGESFLITLNTYQNNSRKNVNVSGGFLLVALTF